MLSCLCTIHPPTYSSSVGVGTSRENPQEHVRVRVRVSSDSNRCFTPSTLKYHLIEFCVTVGIMFQKLGQVATKHWTENVQTILWIDKWKPHAWAEEEDHLALWQHTGSEGSICDGMGVTWPSVKAPLMLSNICRFGSNSCWHLLHSRSSSFQ